MGLYNFQKRFVPFILDGRKTHTIRARRAHPDKPGNTLHLYTGLRTKHAKLLMRVTCLRAEPIAIYEAGNVVVNDVALNASERELLAKRDGFQNWEDMLAFWNGRLPFYGHIIHWKFPE